MSTEVAMVVIYNYACQRYLPRPSRMLLVMVCGDGDHYHINKKKKRLLVLEIQHIENT